MWKIKCDIIFLLVFLCVTVRCLKLTDHGSNRFNDSTSFQGFEYISEDSPKRVNLYGDEVKNEKLDFVIYENDAYLINNVNKINSHHLVLAEHNPVDIKTNDEVPYTAIPQPQNVDANYFRPFSNLIRDEKHFSEKVAETKKRSRRSISNSPTGTSKTDEYPVQLIADHGKSGNQKKGRQLNVDSSIDDIINGIMKLLGGEVKIKAADKKNILTTATTPVLKTRINNRGPPREPAAPFGIPAIPGLTRPIIRPPITATNTEKDLPVPTNTNPPFPVPFPPKLFVPPSKRPYLDGVPLPINILPIKNDESTSENNDHKTAFTSSYTTSDDSSTERNREIIKKIITKKVIPTEPSPLESSIRQDTDNSVDETRIKTATIDDVPTSAKTDQSPNLTVKFSLAANDKSKIRQSSQGMMAVETTTKRKPGSDVIPTKNAIRPIHATGVALPTDISLKETFVYPSIPTRLPDPIIRQRPYGHRGTVLPDSTFPLNQVITAAPATNKNIFDVTVSAIQGYNSPTRPTLQRPVRPVEPLITSAIKSNDGVFIDGRKTYFDLQPGRRPSQTMGVGIVIPEEVEKVPYFNNNRPSKLPVSAIRPTLVKKPVAKIPKPKPVPIHRPTLGPPKRIDTCIVGYDNTCKKDLGEVCRTEGDVSSCFCRPGTGRRRARTKCKKSVILQLSIKVDRVGDRRISWNGNYANPEAREYQILSYEAEKALNSAFTLTAGMNGLYLGSTINKFYSLGGNVIVNSTVQLVRNPQTSSTNIRRSLQRHLIRVIQTNNNYIGKSVLAVEGHLNPIPDVSDVNECFDGNLNDCNSHASCINIFGSFRCTCYKGYTDRNADNLDESGRQCLSCSRDFCSKRGNCTIENEEKVCACDSSFYGARCEIDGEVISVAVGASVVAVIIILLTLILLCWKSRQWKAEDRRAQIFSAAGGFFGWRGRSQPEGAYSMNMRTKGGNPAYGAMMEDRIRWSQMAESLAQQNIYAQPEQMRPAVYPEQRKMPPPPSEYGSVGTMAHQQFGMHYMNPQQFLPTNTAGPNSLSQFTSTSINAASLGGISRAPTLGVRTPQPFRDSRGNRTIGPFGGGIAIKYNRDGLSQDSSEEDDRPYHLPRPKSRGSLADTSDHYFEPDDLMTRYPPLPTSPPPAVPFYPRDFYFPTRLH